MTWYCYRWNEWWGQRTLVLIFDKGGGGGGGKWGVGSVTCIVVKVTYVFSGALLRTTLRSSVKWSPESPWSLSFSWPRGGLEPVTRRAWVPRATVELLGHTDKVKLYTIFQRDLFPPGGNTPMKMRISHAFESFGSCILNNWYVFFIA